MRPADAGGRVVVLADAGLAPVQALVRWDPLGHAARELAERVALRLPPAVRVAELTGPDLDVAAMLSGARLPAGAQVLGPVPIEPSWAGSGAGRPQPGGVRALVRVERRDGLDLAAALHAAAATRSARKEGTHVRIRVDPADLG